MFDIELDKPATVVQGKLSMLREQRNLKYAPPKKINRFLPSQFLTNSSLSSQSQMMDAQFAPQMTIVAAKDSPHSEKAELGQNSEEEKGASVYFIEEGELEIDIVNRHECMVCNK